MTRARSFVLRAARLRDGRLADVSLSDGRVTAVEEPRPAADWRSDDVDVGGRLVLPGLVDAHVHLDKAYTLGQLEQRGFHGGGIGDAIAATKALRDETGLALVGAGMHRLLTMMARQGTVAARAHVELDGGVDPAVVGLHLDAAATHPDVALQLVAFPQNGTSHDPDARSWLERGLDDGCAVVGGCPYADNDPRAHLDLVFSVAAERDLPVDLHLDLTDDVDAMQLGLVLALIEAHGLAGRVTVGHMTALSGLSPVGLREAVSGLRGLGVSLVVIPTTDLWLSGRTPQRPGVRGVAPIAALVEGGVTVALASNNHQNAFTPVGGGGLLRAAWLASLVCQVGDAAGQLGLLTAITQAPATILGLGVWDVAPGSTAPVIVVDAQSALDAVREAPAVLRRWSSSVS